jgi:hypothetical protein
MQITIESTKGSYTGTYAQVLYWLRTNQPSHATLVVPCGTADQEPYRVSLLTQLDTDDAWRAAWAELIEEIYETGIYDTDTEVPHVSAAAAIAEQLPITLDECSAHRCYEDVESAVRWAAHDVWRAEAAQ